MCRCADVMAAEKAKSERTNFVNIKDLAEKRCLHEGCEDAPTLKVAWTVRIMIPDAYVS